jgi:hypothetical protein
MDKIQKPDQYALDGYYGRILSGDYSHQLKKHLGECIERYKAAGMRVRGCTAMFQTQYY